MAAREDGPGISFLFLLFTFLSVNLSGLSNSPAGDMTGDTTQIERSSLLQFLFFI
jgi:hypothetical protein